ncbi:MAG: hypothetical protein R3321_15070, partial [Nitrososphaeraceae archaeon]|nr:hypothetical protein [Nitrososphaeraceae archaeon]
MKKIVLSISVIVFTLYSCDKIDQLFEKRSNPFAEKKEKGVEKNYYPNGNLLSEVRVDSTGRYHGVTKKYYDTGKLKTAINYEHGKRVEARQYYENGQLQMVFNYKDGLKHGKRLKYWPDGKLHSEMSYFEGEPQKGLVEYNKSGKKITKYPRLELRQIDRLASNGTYKVEAYFSSNPQRGTYYIGELKNGTIPKNLPKLKTVNKKGVIT